MALRASAIGIAFRFAAGLYSAFGHGPDRPTA